MKQRRSLSVLISLLVGLASLVSAGTEYPVNPGDEVVAGDLIVRLKPGAVLGNTISAVLPGAQINPMNLPNLYHVHVAGNIATGVSTQLAAGASVDFVAPNRIFHTNLGTPTDTYYSDQWGLTAVQAQAAWSILPAQYLTAATASASRIKVAILDTGADCSHPDFTNTGGSSSDVAAGGQLNWSASQAFVATTVTYPAGCPWMDDYGHGTHVAGIVAAATSNAAGVASLGYPLQVVVYKVLDSTGSGNSVTIANAIITAANAGVQVISMSFGGAGYDAPIQLAINYAWQRNVVAVSAAGNSSSSAVFYPGDASLGVGVAATDSTNNLASFSNFGNGIALAAPGVNILSTLPTYSVPLCCTYAYLSGTSMATPFVSALAGLAATATPGISNTAILQQMQQTATSGIAAGGWNQDLGYGVINAYNAISGTLRPASVGGVVGQIIDTFTPVTSDPISGAQITINGQTVTTDSSGSGLFRFANLAPGTYAVQAAASGYSTQSLTVTVAPGADTPMIIAMASSYGHFSGTVTDGGLAVPGAVVQALSAGLIVGVTVADANGNYTLWIPGGSTSYNLRTSAAGRISVVSSGMSVAAGGNTVANLTLPRMGTITGTVRDGSSHLVSGAQIYVSDGGFSASATTIEGTYTLIGLPNGTYSVTASISSLTSVTQNSVVVSTDTADVVNLQFSGSLPVTVAPVISPNGGSFTTAQAVTITTTTAGASIRYTTDGSTPSETNGTVYGGAISISSTTMLKAIAFATGMADSNVSSATFTIGGGSPGWYNGAWSNRKAVTIPATSGSASLTDFPVLISLASDANLEAGAQASSNDILFTASDGVTKLNHEIELYNGATGQLIAWVQVPVLTPGTVIYMYYGNSSAANQQNRTGVWDSSFAMVQHLPNGTVLSANDSTANGCNASNLNATAATAGEIGGGASFNGTSNSIDFASCAALNNWTAQTVSLWVQARTDMQPYARLIEKGANSEWSVVWDYTGGSGRLTVESLGNTGNLVTSAAVVADNTWHKVDITIAANNLVTLYVDGALSASATSPTSATSKTGTIRLGQYGNGGYYYHGLADELQISNVARTAAWVQTEYTNQFAPSSFYTLGPPQSSAGTVQVTVTSSPVPLALTVDSVGCTAPCSFQWTPGSSHTIAVTTSPQSGGTGTQYLYSSWSDGSAQSHSVTVPSSTTTYTANFTTQYYLTTAANPAAGGTINPASGWYNNGSVVSVGASANSGYSFTGFSGSLSGATTPQNVTLNAAANVTANFSSTSGPGWYNNAWSNRKAVTIPATSGSASLTDFPVLISLASDANLEAGAQTSGNDILFTASDGVTKLNHEIELYNSATGQLIAWVQVPVLTPGTVIYMYYGNSSAANQQNRTGVWDSSFAMVQHLPNGTVLSANDSTANGCNASNLNSTAATAGEIGGGASFNGTSNSIDFASCAALNNWTAQTVSLWVQARTDMQEYARLIEKGANNEWSVVWNYGGGGRLTVESLGSTGNLVTSAAVVADNTWHKVDVTIAANNLVSLYMDGALSASATSPTSATSKTGTIRLGQYGNGGYYYHGLADELQISNVARTAAWVQTEYTNQFAPGSFYTLGAPQTSGSTVQVTVTSLPVPLALTVDSVGCTAPCSFQWTPGSSHTIAVTTSPQSGGTATQYVYASWSDGLAQSHSVTVPSSTTTYTANFSTQYYLTTAANPTAGGTINPASAWYNSGSVVSVGASANSGYSFTSFSGTLSGATTPQNVTLNAAASVTANFSSTSGPGWYNNAWSNRKAVTIPATSGSASLTDFPVLISLPSDANLQAGAQASGNDILFTASDGSTKLNHEIELYNSATGQLIAWVQVPVLTPGTVIYMYYGNSSAANQQNRTGVWDSSFSMVQHLPNGTVLSANDSTANGCNASNLNSTAATAGEIGGGASFNGTSNSIDFASCAALNNWTAQTVSLWVQARTDMQEYARLIEKGANNEWSVVWNYTGGSDRLTVQSLGNTGNLVSSAAVVADNTWHKVDITIAANNLVTLYVDGAFSASATSPTSPATRTGTIRLGQYGGGGYYYHGLADELQISNVARTAAWVQTEYTNQFAPASFYTLGPPQNAP